MAEAPIGIGNESYYLFKAESTYDSAETSSMTLIPIDIEGSEIPDPDIQMIENNRAIGSRLKSDPDLGRIVNGPFSPVCNMHPDQIGLLLQQACGSASTTGPTDSAYTHVMNPTISGTRLAKSFTAQYAKGSNTATTVSGNRMTGLTITGDNQGNCKVSFPHVGASNTNGVARISTFTIPSTTPFKVGDAVLQLTPSGASQFTQLVKTFELVLDNNYNTEQFYTSSRTMQNPKFNGPPSLTFRCTIDAEKQFLDYAQAHTEFQIDLTLTNVDDIGAGSTKYSLAVEIPVARLLSTTTIPLEDGILQMTLEFDASYGGTTTGSPSANQLCEFTLVDGTTAYA